MLSEFLKKKIGKTSSEESSGQRSISQTSQVPSHRRVHYWGAGYSRDFSSYDDFSGFRRRSEYDYDSDSDSDSPPRGGYLHLYSRNEGYPSHNFSPPGNLSYGDDYSQREYRRREVQTPPSSYQIPVQNVTARPPPMQLAASQPRLDRKYSKILDAYRSLEKVTRSVDTELGQLSPQEQKTVESIFVNFTEIMSKNVSQTRKETEFALESLMEVPLQYQATLELGILGRVSPKSPGNFPLPPPPGSYNVASFQSHYLGDHWDHELPELFDPMDIDPMENESPAPPPGASSEEQCCPICLTNPKDMAFGCGHQTCRDCGPRVDNCPICRRPIDIRIRLY